MDSFRNLSLRLRGFLSRIFAAYQRRPALLQPTATGALLAIGIGFLDFHIGWMEVVLLTTTAVAVETVAARVRLGRPPVVASALSAAFSLALFFRATHWYLYVAVAAVAILSKYVIRNSRGHLFNPSNFAIVAFVFLLPSSATIQFIEWGSSAAVYLGISFAVYAIAAWATRTGDITFPFVASYGVLFMGVASFVPSLVVPHHYGLLSPVLAIFAAFMITDPQTAPRGRVPRMLYGVSIACSYFALELLGVRYALFVALPVVLCLCGGTGWLWRRYFSKSDQTLTPHLAAGAVAAALLVACLFGVSDTGRAPSSPSLNFLLFGIQSSNLFECKLGKVFNPNTHTGLPHGDSVFGAAWGDIDGDGQDDLFLSGVEGRLYKNDHGSFVDITRSSGVPNLYTSSAFFADYDNDADPDLFVVLRWNDPGSAYPLRVYRNVSGHFSDVTEEVGLGDFSWGPYGLGSLSFADYDNDGLLDFVAVSAGKYLRVDVGNLAFSNSLQDPRYSPSSSRVCGEAITEEQRALIESISDPAERAEARDTLSQEGACLLIFNFMKLLSGDKTHTPGVDASMLSFAVFVPGEVHMFRNAGGSFEQRPSITALVKKVHRSVPMDLLTEGKMATGTLSGRFFQPVSFDYDEDGRMDIFIATDIGSSVLLRNEGGFEFTDRTAEAGLQIAASGMGVDVADVNADGHPDLFVTNVLDDFLFYNRGDGTFVPPARGMGAQGIGWGTAFLDYDLDGRDDIFVANGDLQRTSGMPLFELNTAYFRADALYHNKDGMMADATWIDYCSDFQSGRPLAVSDYDNDGDPDVFVGNLLPHGKDSVEAINFFRNTSLGSLINENSIRRGKSGPHYLAITLRGTRSNAMGVGARISVVSEQGRHTKYVVLGSSFYSQNSLVQVFGTGVSAAPVSVEVQWPSGAKTRFENIPIDQRIVITE